MLQFLAPFLLWFSLIPKETEEARVQKIFQEFTSGYRALQLPVSGYSYEQHLRTIAQPAALLKRQRFFESYDHALSRIKRGRLLPATRLDYDHLRFETALHLERLRLELRFRQTGDQSFPATGLSSLPDAKDWYAYYVQRLTSVAMTPDELIWFGQQEVAHAKQQIWRLQARLGYAHDSAGFYRHLQEPRFFLTREEQIMARYDSIKATACRNLARFVADTVLPELLIRPLPEAGPHSPPAYYSPAEDEGNQTGKGIFYFGFYGNRHNTRQMEWMFMHEGLPGHHYQYSLRKKLPQEAPF